MVARFRLNGSKPKKRRGGPVAGSGRKPGSKNKSTAAIREAAAESGELPHEFALKIARAQVGDVIAGHMLTWDDIKWAVHLAAPFFAARMASVQVSGKDGGPIRLTALPPELLQRLSYEELTTIRSVYERVQVANTPLIEGDARAYEDAINGEDTEQ